MAAKEYDETGGRAWVRVVFAGRNDEFGDFACVYALTSTGVDMFKVVCRCREYRLAGHEKPLTVSRYREATEGKVAQRVGVGQAFCHEHWCPKASRDFLGSSRAAPTSSQPARSALFQHHHILLLRSDHILSPTVIDHSL